MNAINHNQILAEAAARYLRETGAINYTGAVFTITFTGRDEQIEVLVTTQKVGASTPHDLRIKAETQRDVLRDCLSDAREWLGDYPAPTGLAKPRWTQEYCSLVERIDETLMTTQAVET